MARSPGDFVSRAWPVAMIGLVLVLAVPTALVAIGEGAGALRLPFNLHVVDLRLPLIFKLHMLASGLALLLIPLVVYARRNAKLHKVLGRIAAVCVVLGGLTSVPVALMSDSVLMARAGFLAQGVVWLFLIVQGVRAVRARRFTEHARLMLMMAAVASGAIWVRLVTAVATGDAQAFQWIYGSVTWLGWLLPLGLVAYATRTRKNTRRPQVARGLSTI